MDERALRRLAHDVDEQHREQMRSLDNGLAGTHATSRRRFLRRAAAGGAVMFGATAVPLATLVSSVPTAGAQTTKVEPLSSGDTELTRFAQSLELAAVEAYGAIERSRRLTGPVAETARMFAGHHRDHADALGKILTEGGADAVTEANAAVVQFVTAALRNASDEAGVLRVAFDLEQGAAASYLLALGRIESVTTAGAAATILPVESQHAVVWGQVLELPEPDFLPAFGDVDGAFDPATYAIS